MRINGNRDAIIQRMMVQKAGKPNNTNSRAKDAAYKASDSGGESASAKRGDQTTGINYSQLATMVVPPSAVRNREQDRDNGANKENGAADRQSAQASKSSGGDSAKQAARAATGQSPRAESGGYNSAAQADRAQSGYAKGDIVNLSA